MYKKILIAYDGSEFSDIALKQGCDLARLCGAQVQLVGIVATTGYSAMAEGVGGIDIWGMERDALAAALADAAGKISSQGLQAGTSLREGNPAHEIASHAKEMGADLVVVGHSDKGILSRWFEGSVGAGLLRELPCNLLVATS